MIILIRDNVEKIVDSEERANALQEKGYVRVKEKEPKKDFSTMTKAQLLEYAKAHGIEVNPRAKKADILAAL